MSAGRAPPAVCRLVEGGQREGDSLGAALAFARWNSVRAPWLGDRLMGQGRCYWLKARVCRPGFWLLASAYW